MEKVNITVDHLSQGMRVDQFLSHYVQEPRELVKQQAQNIFVNSKIIKPSYRIQVGDIIEWEYSPTIIKENTLIGENIPLDILFEDEYLIVLNKPAGMVVHPAKGHWTGTLSHALAYHLKLKEDSNLRPGIVHRLDKDTSGLMVIAKTPKSQKGLMRAFKERKILKIYTALVQGHLSTTHGMIDAPLARSKKNRLMFCVDEINGKEALSEYQVVRELKKATLMRVRIHTGRTHQIRVHLSHIGTPIIGDPFYSRWYKDPPLCLVSTRLGFIHPITEEKMEFNIPIPPKVQERIDSFE